VKRLLICLGSFVAVPAALAGVKQAALTGEPDVALACATAAIAAAWTAAWITAQAGMAIRNTLPRSPRYRGSRGNRWTGREGGAWR
jgi:hypothetical protein